MQPRTSSLVSRHATAVHTPQPLSPAALALACAPSQAGYKYTFVRPGQLFGGPYDNNYYLGTLFQLDKDADTREVRTDGGLTAA